jgi:hypothetical protein
LSTQNKIIDRYRLFFPQETLRQTSLRTGIQITRVFRLFSGKAMKVRELEAFETAINLKLAESPSFARLNRITEEASLLLTNEEIGRIADYMERKIANKKFSRTYIYPIFEDASIA